MKIIILDNKKRAATSCEITATLHLPMSQIIPIIRDKGIESLMPVLSMFMPLLVVLYAYS